MVSLDDEQIRILRHYKIPESAVLDARSMKRSEYQEELKKQGKAVALVDRDCNRGHQSRLRLISGHCIECSPQGVAHWKRHQEPAFVYIAYSRTNKLVKIGISKAATERLDGINRDGYGGATDWKILYRRKFDRAGYVESQVDNALAPYASPKLYVRLQRDGEIQTLAKEMFDCDYHTAREVVESFSSLALGQAYEF